MVKAYTAAAQSALEQLPRSLRIAWVEMGEEITACYTTRPPA